MTRTHLRGAGRIIALSLILGCSDSTGAATPALLLIVPNPVDLFTQDSVHLVVSVLTAASAVIPGVPVTFTSADTSIVKVAADGRVSSANGLGLTTITVAAGGLLAPVATTVSPPLTTLPGDPYGVAVSPTGVAYVTQLGTHSIARFDLPRPSITKFIAVGDFPTSVAFNNTGTRAYVADQLSQDIAVINTATDAWIDTIPVNGDPFVAVTPPGDSLLYVGTNANQIYIIRLATNAIIDSIATPDAPIFLVPHGGNIYASITFAGQVLEISLATHAILRPFTGLGTVQGIAIAPNGSELYAVDQGGWVRVVSLSSGVVVDSIALPGGGGSSIARNPADGYLYVTTAYFGTGVHVIDPVTRTVVRPINTGGDPRRIAFNASGSRGIIANQAGWVDFVH